MLARTDRNAAPRDPLAWCWIVSTAFLLLLLHRLTIPSKPFFDEIHYLPAARSLLALDRPLNREHPLVAKELLAAAMALLGDNPFGWRFGSALAGALGLLAAMRAVWWATLSRSATLLAGVLLASDFTLFVSARIAMLDPYMAAFTLVALWFFARAMRRPNTARQALALCGLFLGLAVGAKWTAAPLLPMPMLAFAAVRFERLRRRRDRHRSMGSILADTPEPGPRVRLWEAALWLVVLPLLTYLATFAPTFFYARDPLTLAKLLPLQRQMSELQESIVQLHPYQSRWWQWVFNLRPIWFLYEVVDGAQRGVLFVGNPLTMLLGLPALAWCLWWGWRERRWAMLASVGLFAAALAPWLVVPKPIQFYYHYLLPSTFLVIALALVLGRWWDRGRQRPGLYTAAISLALFAWFHPILSAAALPRVDSFVDYTWLKTWR